MAECFVYTEGVGGSNPSVGTMEKRKIVIPSPETMYGDTKLEKELNSCLTLFYITKGEIPSDECIAEARHIITNLMKSPEMIPLDALVKKYLETQFGGLGNHDLAVHQVLDIIKRNNEAA
jgi:hypothetical protein